MEREVLNGFKLIYFCLNNCLCIVIVNEIYFSFVVFLMGCGMDSSYMNEVVVYSNNV